MEKERSHVKKLINVFKNANSKFKILPSDTPIQIVMIPGNEEVKKVAKILQENDFDIRPILYPTVPKGGERLRVVMHAFNSLDEVKNLLHILNVSK